MLLTPSDIVKILIVFLIVSLVLRSSVFPVRCGVLPQPAGSLRWLRDQ